MNILVLNNCYITRNCLGCFLPALLSQVMKLDSVVYSTWKPETCWQIIESREIHMIFADYFFGFDCIELFEKNPDAITVLTSGRLDAGLMKKTGIAKLYYNTTAGQFAPFWQDLSQQIKQYIGADR